jgi:hypothetical protein
MFENYLGLLQKKSKFGISAPEGADTSAPEGADTSTPEQ